MAHTYHLRCWTRFHAPAEEVWAWKTDPARLNQERMPLVRLDSDPAALGRAMSGAATPSETEARVSLLGVVPGPRWMVRVEACEPGRRMLETSPDNPMFSQWEHERLLESGKSDGCRWLDAITFTPRFPASRAVARMVEELFIHMHKQSARFFKADGRATAVAMLRLADEPPEPDEF